VVWVLGCSCCRCRFVRPLGCACPRYLVTLVWLSLVLVRHVVVLPLLMLLPPSLLQPPLVLHVRPPSA
jgi:hypothetical protein